MIDIKDRDEIIEVQEDAIEDDVIYRTIKDPYGFIYITTNLVNGKRYLGQRQFSQGWQTYLGSGIAFKKAIIKYGKENFHRDIVYICYSKEELNQIEYELSVFFNVVELDDWYNLVLGGGTSRGWKPNEETKRKISNKAKERLSDPKNHPMYGKEHLKGTENPMYGVSPKERMDEETYQQWYDKHKQYWENPVNKGKHIWKDKPHPNLGKTLPDEQKKKISDTRLKNHIGCKPIYSLEFDRIFFGAREILEMFGFKKPNITMCCNKLTSYCGRHPDTNEQLHWLYVYDNVRRNGECIQGAITLGYITEERVNEYLNNLKQKGNDK